MHDHGERLDDADSISGTLGMMVEELRRPDTARARLRQAVRWAGARPTSGMDTPGDRRGSVRAVRHVYVAATVFMPANSGADTAGFE